MPITGNGDAGLSLLLRNLTKLPGYEPQMLAEAVPTVEKLLSHATAPGSMKGGREGPVRGDVAPTETTWAGRRYNVSPELQARIDANTIVAVDGKTIRVSTASDNPHLRPVVPLTQLPLKWRGAISAKINGAIRRALRTK